jgi:hypothetical protein
VVGPRWQWGVMLVGFGSMSPLVSHVVVCRPLGGGTHLWVIRFNTTMNNEHCSSFSCHVTVNNVAPDSHDRVKGELTCYQ